MMKVSVEQDQNWSVLCDHGKDSAFIAGYPHNLQTLNQPKQYLQTLSHPVGLGNDQDRYLWSRFIIQLIVLFSQSPPRRQRLLPHINLTDRISRF